MSAVIVYSRGLREKAWKTKQALEECGIAVKLREVDEPGKWEIWFPWGVAKDYHTVIEYYRVYRGRDPCRKQRRDT